MTIRLHIIFFFSREQITVEFLYVKVLKKYLYESSETQCHSFGTQLASYRKNSNARNLPHFIRSFNSRRDTTSCGTICAGRF